VSIVDDAAFTPAVDSGTPAMGVFDDTGPDSVDEGDAGVLRMSGNRSLYIVVRDAAGNERGLNITSSNEAAVKATLADSNVQVLGTPTVTGTSVVSGTSVVDVNSIAAGNNNIGNIDVLTLIPGTSANQLGKAEDAAHATGDTGVLLLGVRNDGGIALAGSSGDYIPLGTDSSGNLRVQAAVQPGVDIGDVTVNNDTLEVVGDVANDAAAAGNPVLIGARANAETPSTVADADAVYLWADQAGRLMVTDGHPDPEAPTYVNVIASSDTAVVATPGTSLALHIRSVMISNASSTDTPLVALREGSSGSSGAIRSMGRPAVDGGGFVWDYGADGWELAANTGLTCNLSASGNIYVNVLDYYISS
jgi:hypothetical protein